MMWLNLDNIMLSKSDTSRRIPRGSSYMRKRTDKFIEVESKTEFAGAGKLLTVGMLTKF